MRYLVLVFCLGLAWPALAQEDGESGESTVEGQVQQLESAAEQQAAAVEEAEPVPLEPFTLQIKWLPQAQFAGYYVAQANGYYAEEGLDVTILPGGPDVDPLDALRNGSADVAIDWLPPVLHASERGAALVNIAQIFQFSGQTVACRDAAGVETPEDLRGKTVAFNKGGDEFAVRAWFNSLGIPIDGSDDGITLVDRAAGVSDIIDGTADCITAQTYNELGLLDERGFNANNMTIFDFEELGVATLQDGIYATQSALSDPDKVDQIVRFLRASLKGWRSALARRDTAVQLVLQAMQDPAASRDHQLYMITEVGRLIGPTDDFLGLLMPETYEVTIDRLEEGGVLAQAPAQGWSHSLWLQAQ